MSGTKQLARRLALAGAAFALLHGAADAGERRPVPTVTIYPGDVVRADMLVDSDFPDAVASNAFVSNHSALIGKVAKRTLLPGRPIPANAVGEPKLVVLGAMVRVIYEDSGLEIVTYASAMQGGAAGDFISVRNTETGLTVGGVIRPDGSVHVGPG